MRILYISHSFGSWGTPDNIWDRNLRQTLVEMGHDVLLPPYDQNMTHKECSIDKTGEARARNSEAFVTAVQKYIDGKGLDLVFTYFDNRHVIPGAILQVRHMGVLTINFFCNAQHFDQVAEVAPAFDYCMVPERETLDKYRAVGARPVHIPMAANPKFYRPTGDIESIDAAFIGNNYFNRESYLAYLFAHGIDIKVYGPGWIPEHSISCNELPMWLRPRRFAGALIRKCRQKIGELRGEKLPVQQCFPPVDDETMVRLYSVARIALGLSDVISSDGKIIRFVRLRDFEATMSGACYLTGYQEELAGYYEIGKDIDCYNSKEELLDKVKHYLTHDTERRKMREKGRQRAISEHTWRHRFEKLFKETGLSSVHFSR